MFDNMPINKDKTMLLLLLAVVCFTACNKEPIALIPTELATVSVNLTSSFDSLNFDVAVSSEIIALNSSDTVEIRAQMLRLFNHSSFILSSAFVNSQGILLIIEPASHYSVQGADISEQNHIKQIFQTKQPALSDVFFAAEGYYAAVVAHPVLSNGQVIGGITPLFLPETILGRIIAPLVKNQEFEMWVMEKGGTVIYDQDAEEIGLNLFTDTLYQSFTELIEAARLIAGNESGETYYSFYQTGTHKKVVKKTYWITFYLYGSEWKIVWVKPE
ncbi:MAG: cache domain-containing protein [Bacteroidota bacterium]